MMLPIRVRLTLWYSSLNLLTLVVFAGTMYFGIRAVLQASVDVHLANRIVAVESFLRREVPRFDQSRIQDELEENVLIQSARTNPDLEPIGGEMLQISDGRGQWLCQSQSMAELGIAAPKTALPVALQTLKLKKTPFRVRTASMSIDGRVFVIQVAATLMPLFRAMESLSRLLIGSIPLLVLAASACGYWLSRRALAPVDHIIEASRAISHQNLSQRLLVPQSRDELQRLSETINEMIERLDHAFKRMVRFTADTSHELRSPVALIRTTAEVALLRPRNPDHYRGALAEVLKESERMTVLIEHLLELARADSNRSNSEVVLKITDLREIVHQAGKHIARSAFEKGVDFQLNLPDEEIGVPGESTMLRRLFLILLENAVKYTQAGGHVRMNVEMQGAHAVVSVQDSGIGIAEQELPLIFERFYRSDKARQRDSGGVGLGLSIASWIAEVHRTHIAVQSRVGVGSTFSVALPIIRLERNANQISEP